MRDAPSNPHAAGCYTWELASLQTALAEIRAHQRGHAAAHQRGLEPLLFDRCGVYEVPLPAPRSLFEGHRNPVPIQDPVRRQSGYDVPRRNDPGEVERIGATHGHQLARRRVAPHVAQQPHRLAQGVLLAREAAHEAAAADLATRFEPAVPPQDVAPPGEPPLAPR